MLLACCKPSITMLAQPLRLAKVRLEAYTHTHTWKVVDWKGEVMRESTMCVNVNSIYHKSVCKRLVVLL